MRNHEARRRLVETHGCERGVQQSAVGTAEEAWVQDVAPAVERPRLLAEPRSAGRGLKEWGRREGPQGVSS